MRMIAAIVFGVVLSFGLTIFGEYVVVNAMSNRFLGVGVLCPSIALIVGASAGLANRSKARIAAALSLAPWTVWLVIATNAGHSTVSRWVTTTALVSVCLALGVGAAALVGRRMNRSTMKGSKSPSQEHA